MNKVNIFKKTKTMVKKDELKVPNFIYAVIGIIILIITITLGSYVLNFHNQIISDDTAKWGAFGDYLGGTLNVVIGFANLVILGYITFRIAKIEEDRNENNYKNSVRPAFGIISTIYPNKFELLIHSYGLGPLIIKKITIITVNGTKYFLISEFLDTLPFTFMDYYKIKGFDFSEMILGVDKEFAVFEISLLLEKADVNYELAFKLYNDILDEIEKVRLVIEYTDVFENEIFIKEDKINILR